MTECAVTVQLAGRDQLVGTLFSRARHGVETSTFSYAEGYLSHPDAFPIAPDLPLLPGPIHSQGRPMFRAFEDCMPDRWGRNLMLRAERLTAGEEGRTARSLFEHDYLTGVNDETRQGALRFWQGEKPLAPFGSGVPREVDIPSLLGSADRAARDMNADIRDLLAAGSSLGGARPKASVRDERGTLHIAKFPKADELPVDDVCAWECVALELASRCGIRVPRTRLIRIGGRSVLMLERFDREGTRRTPYLSGMTAVQGDDGATYSYLELIDFLEMEGAAPERDIRELWQRVLLSAAIGNCDDHMRNHGFLRTRGGWRLSPAFDVNPTVGDQPKLLSTAIDFDRREAEPSVVLECAGFFRLSEVQARAHARSMASQLRAWRKIAQQRGIGRSSIESMRTCFESGISKLERIA